MSKLSDSTRYPVRTPTALDRLIGTDPEDGDRTVQFEAGGLGDLAAGRTVLRGLAASRPAAGNPGRLYYATDTQALSRDTGSAWEAVTPTPASHAAQHASAGSDPLTPAAIGAATAAALSAHEAAPAAAAHGGVLAGYSADQAVYVAQWGHDGNTGATPSAARLTIGAGLTAAAALAPSASNRVVVHVLDAGSYPENLTLVTNVDLFAPAATLLGTLTLADDSAVVLNQVLATANGQVLVSKATGTGTSYCTINEIDGRGDTGTRTSVGCVRNTAAGGILILQASKIWVGASGSGIGDSSTGVGHIHVNVEDLYLAGASALGVAGNITNSTILVRAGHILEFGAVTGTTGIAVGSSGDVYVSANQLIADTAYTINGAGNLRLICPEVQGARSGAAACELSDDVVNIATGGSYRVAGTQVVGERQSAIASVATGGSATAAENATAINSILAALRAHGLIAP